MRFSHNFRTLCKHDNMADYAGGSAYGAGGAGSEFNPVEFVKRPDVILRIVGWVFAIIVFGCISSQGWIQSPGGQHVCFYNGNSGACGFGTFVGVMAFLVLIGFLIATAMFDRLSNVQHRAYVVMADIAVSGIFAFFYFVAFCFLTNQWSVSSVKYNKSGAEAAIAFSFFSIFIFVALTVLAVKKYRLGVSDSFQSDYNPDFYRESTPAPYAGGTSSAYQGGTPSAPPPFSATESKPAAAGYQQTY